MQALLYALNVQVAGPAENTVVGDISVTGAVLTLRADGSFPHAAGVVDWKAVVGHRVS